jgi:CubicO group peptidase (beta-lactamase class C family)
MKYNGYIGQKFKGIETVFLDNFLKHGEIGASLCVYHKNELVVDIWGGYKDLKKQNEWNENTVVPIFSSTKAIAASCMAICHSRGLFDYQDKVSDYWIEFAQNGKENITIEELLQHRAGVSAIDKKLSIEIIRNRKLLENIIAEQKPNWIPGEYQGYHVWSIGWYISTLLSRIDPKRRRLKEFVEEELIPNISGEIRIGINDDFDMNRIATLKPFSKIKGFFSLPFPLVREFFNPSSLTFRTMLNPVFASNHKNFNKKEILKLEIGAGGGIGNAKGLASLLDALTSPKHSLFLGQKTLDYLTQYPELPLHGFKDIVFNQEAFIAHAGFMKPSKKHNFSNSKKAFGGFGAGGSFVVSDPENRLTIAYTMNNMSQDMMNMKREFNIRSTVYKTVDIMLN